MRQSVARDDKVKVPCYSELSSMRFESAMSTPFRGLLGYLMPWSQLVKSSENAGVCPLPEDALAHKVSRYQHPEHCF